MSAFIPPGFTSKQALLAALAEECVRDLSWLPVGQVVLTHADVPLVNDVASARTYLAILGDSVRKMSKSEDQALSVVFPAKFREQIDWLLRS